jgi:hypothetical protein
MTLTAAKDGKPKGEGAANSFTFTVPQTEGDKTFSLKNISES